MKYKKCDPKCWQGRISDQQRYLHEKISFLDLEKEHFEPSKKTTFAFLGYACDEGVRRNQGRTGAVEGPDAIRRALAKMPNHLAKQTALIDLGTLTCPDGNMELIQSNLAENVRRVLQNNAFPILVGGGHDIAYGHFKGIQNFVGSERSIGIINFDAHFDLRVNDNGANSGTPFYQIAQDCMHQGAGFNYLCLGIRRDANDQALFNTAERLDVQYIERPYLQMHFLEDVQQQLEQFIQSVDYLYTSIDLDGFSTAFAPGVSASSPMGFGPDIVLECLKSIVDSKKLISIDLAEMNPRYDRDGQTAKLAASLIHFLIHRLEP